MSADELLTTLTALFGKLADNDANVFVHEGGLPFGVRGEKKRVRGCYLSKDAEGELCIVIEAENVKPQGVTENCSCMRSCENCMLAHGCQDYEFDHPEAEASRCPRFTPINTERS